MPSTNNSLRAKSAFAMADSANKAESISCSSGDSSSSNSSTEETNPVKKAPPAKATMHKAAPDKKAE